MSMYRGKVKRYGVEFTKKSEPQVTNAKEQLICPHCKKADKLNYVDETIQMGFEGYNHYQEFWWCEDCQKGVCIVTVRRGMVYFGR